MEAPELDGSKVQIPLAVVDFELGPAVEGPRSQAIAAKLTTAARSCWEGNETLQYDVERGMVARTGSGLPAAHRG